MLAKAPGRPNPIARLPSNGIAGPLLIQGPVDVVPASQERWQHPPFGGYLVDGFLWGLGSLDMKSGIAMMPQAILRGKTDGMTPGGDIVLATVSDEESGGDQVARYLVEDRQELFAGIKYALGEGGGFGFQMGGRRFYPIMVADKQVCYLRATFRGTGGHASLATQHNPMTDMVQLLQRAIPDPGSTRGPNNVPGHRQTCLAACPCQNSDPVQSTIHGLDVEIDGHQGPYIQPIVSKYRQRHIGAGRRPNQRYARRGIRESGRPNLAQPLAGAVDIRINRDHWPCF